MERDEVARINVGSVHSSKPQMCWNFTALHVAIFSFMLGKMQRWRSGLFRFICKNHLGRNEKRWRFGPCIVAKKMAGKCPVLLKNTCFCCYEDSWEMSQSFIKNTWSCRHEGRWKIFRCFTKNTWFAATIRAEKCPHVSLKIPGSVSAKTARKCPDV